MQTTQQRFIVSYHRDALVKPRPFTDQELNDALIVRFMPSFNEQGEERVLSWEATQIDVDFSMGPGEGALFDLIAVVLAIDEGESLQKIINAMNVFLIDELGIWVRHRYIDVREAA